MKKIMTVIVALMALVLVGCADHYPEYAQHQAEVDNDNKAMLAAYFASQNTRDSVMFSSLNGKLDPTAAVLYSFMANQQNAAIVASFRSKGLVAPTTSMDVWNTFMGKTFPTVAKWGFSYLIAGDLFDALGAGMSVGGDYVSQTNRVDTGGGDFTNNFDYSKSTTTNTAGDDIMLDSYNPTTTNY